MINNIRKVFYIISIICVAIISISSCKAQKSDAKKGIITFHMGDVEILRSNNKIVQATMKDTIFEKDTIKTGKDSFVTVQIENKGIIKIQEKSILKFQTLFSSGKADLFLQKGEVLSKIQRLEKNEDFQIKTPVAVASVRGTQFSTSYIDGHSAVVVKEGKVGVGKKSSIETQTEDNVYQEEEIIEAGNTAEIKEAINGKIESVKIAVRPMNDIEKIKVEKIEDLKIIPEIENKSVKELKEFQSDKKEDDIKEVDKKEATLIKKEKVNNQNVVPKVQQAKIKELLNKKTKTLNEIKEVFDRIDEITLYNKRVVKGAIIDRGEKNYKVITTEGTIVIKKDDIKRIRVIQ